MPATTPMTPEAGENANTTTISVLVCTRGRGDTVRMALDSILSIPDNTFELVLIDQNPDCSTKQAVLPYLHDARLKYVHASDTKGLGLAHNLGMEHSSGSIVAITDDDCTVPADWLEQIKDVFESHPNVGIVFCSVMPGEHDAKLGFIPGFECKRERIIANPFTWRGGIGAGMAVRRTAVEAIGGFDALLGPGAVFPAADDCDIAIRMVINGYQICETNRTLVTHYGFRTFEEGKELTKRDSYGYGAAMSKHIAARNIPMIVSIFLNFLYFVKVVVVASVKHRKPTGAKRLVYFILGLASGLTYSIDRKTMRFLSQR